jgi:ABC-2 type transport system ATP-binding protein
LIGRLRELPAASLDRRITSLLELFQLQDAAEQDIASYSKGMRQKVLLIAALLHDPDLLILDEPDSGLDVTTALVLRHLITLLASRGKAVLYSSHVLETVEKLCSRVLVLHQGRVVADDSVERLRTAMASDTLEEVVTHLMLRQDPERTARDILDVVTTRA